ncbi:hypothetical protein MBA34_17915 [Pseudomonas capeferrum]|uniref:tetratricopeptide repeat protein n=1 Tax=Pseudomonas capeferrum TaxID=1495066 RepID=UPI0004DA385F|nr:hypothetical protein [Pseudomonas capeferrum]KEY87842.1 hypothetical protein PC358_01645 [Pseudomonas capeferrum]MCH7300896.1 hypothetical protein [Pseudomonas capeferrum]
MAVAKTISDTLVEELNILANSGSILDPFTSARLRRDIKKLESAHFIAARICLGILYTIENNAEKSLSTFEETLSLDPSDRNIHTNYAHALSKFRKPEAACRHYKIAADLSPDHHALIDLAEAAQIIFKPRIFSETIKSNLDKIDIDALEKNINARATLQLATLFEQNNISDDEANKIYKIAESIMSERNIGFKKGNFRRTDNYGGSTVTFYAAIEGSADLIHELNETLCDRIVDFDACHILKDIMYVFIPYHQEPTVNSL